MGLPVAVPGWIQPRGYSNGMRARGEVVAIAGQIAWDASGRLVDGGFTEQFAQALSNVVEVVRAAGGGPTDVVSLTIYVVDRQEYLDALARVGESYRAIMGKHYPAMALVIVAGLLEPAARVEIQGLAVIA